MALRFELQHVATTHFLSPHLEAAGVTAMTDYSNTAITCLYFNAVDARAVMWSTVNVIVGQALAYTKEANSQQEGQSKNSNTNL